MQTTLHLPFWHVKVARSQEVQYIYQHQANVKIALPVHQHASHAFPRCARVVSKHSQRIVCYGFIYPLTSIITTTGHCLQLCFACSVIPRTPNRYEINHSKFIIRTTLRYQNCVTRDGCEYESSSCKPVKNFRSITSFEKFQ